MFRVEVYFETFEDAHSFVAEIDSGKDIVYTDGISSSGDVEEIDNDFPMWGFLNG